MPRKKELPETLVIDREVAPVTEVKTKTISRKMAKALLQGKDPNEPPKPRKRTENQIKAWQRNVEMVKERAAQRRAEKEAAAAAAAEEEKRKLETAEKVIVRVRAPRGPPKEKATKTAIPASEEDEQIAKVKPLKKRVPSPQYETEEEELTALDTDIPASESDKEPVRVPRRVKKTVKAVKAIDRVIEKVTSGEGQYDALLSKYFK